MRRPGLFRDVIGPLTAWFGKGARHGAKQGFGNLRSNAGFGWSALKGDPKTVMGAMGLQTMGRYARGAGRSVARGDIRGLREHARGFGRAGGSWFGATDLAGQGKLRGLAIGARAGAIPGTFMAADFLNPWGLGWGD